MSDYIRGVSDDREDYVSDQAFANYHTLNDGSVSEDTSILFVALAHESKTKIYLGYNVTLQILPGLVCAAIETSSISREDNPSGYKFCKTTSEKYRIGEIPSKTMDYLVNGEYYPAKSFTVEIAG